MSLTGSKAQSSLLPRFAFLLKDLLGQDEQHPKKRTLLLMQQVYAAINHMQRFCDQKSQLYWKEEYVLLPEFCMQASNFQLQEFSQTAPEIVLTTIEYHFFWLK